MRWYEGDIAQAVAMSKSKNAIFVVYIEGKTDKSTNLTSIIDSHEISSKLESESFVAIKIEAGSVLYTQFSAIYKNVRDPSIFFIGKNGKVIDIVLESQNVNDLSQKIQAIMKIHFGVPVTSPTPSTAAKPSADLIQNEAQSSSKTKDNRPENVICENGVCYKVSNRPTTSKQSENDSAAFIEEENVELSLEEKVLKAKELIEKKRDEKQQEEEETSRVKEIERRKMGQEVQKMRRRQQDEELKSLMEERQKAKNEDKLARERILAQIAQDKADRVARFKAQDPAISAQQQNPAKTAYPTQQSNTARIQFRFPDGTSSTRDFESDAVLRDVREFVVQNLNVPFRNFSLSTTFPRREFTEADQSQTLRDLQLCPNAVILILPSQASGTVSTQSSAGFFSLVWLSFSFLLSPVFGLFEYIRSIFFGEQQATSNTQTPISNAETWAAIERHQRRPRTNLPRRLGTSNIYRLSDQTESDEDNNTWNGNSTQQM